MKNRKGLVFNPSANFSSAVAEEEALDQEELELQEALDEQQQLFNETIANIRRGLKAGVFNDYEDPDAVAEDLTANAQEELKMRQAEILGLEYDEEDDEDDAEYAGSFDLATFSANATQFGSAILELADAEYEDPLEGLAVVADHTGLSVDELLGLIAGEYTADEELAAQIAECFESTQDEEVYEGFMSLADEAEESEEDSDEEGEESAEYSRYNAQLEQLRRENDRIQAEFSAAQQEKVIGEALTQIEIRASRGVQEGWLPPVAQRTLIGNFSSANERIAAFSTLCDANQVDEAQQLIAMEYVLDIFEKCGPYNMFSNFSAEPLEDHEVAAIQNEEAAVAATFDFYRKQNPLNIHESTEA